MSEAKETPAGEVKLPDFGGKRVRTLQFGVQKFMALFRAMSLGTMGFKMVGLPADAWIDSFFVAPERPTQVWIAFGSNEFDEVKPGEKPPGLHISLHIQELPNGMKLTSPKEAPKIERPPLIIAETGFRKVK